MSAEIAHGTLEYTVFFNPNTGKGVKIYPDGEVVFEGGVDPEGASKEFWRHVSESNPIYGETGDILTAQAAQVAELEIQVEELESQLKAYKSQIRLQKEAAEIAQKEHEMLVSALYTDIDTLNDANSKLANQLSVLKDTLREALSKEE